MAPKNEIKRFPITPDDHQPMIMETPPSLPIPFQFMGRASSSSTMSSTTSSKASSIFDTQLFEENTPPTSPLTPPSGEKDDRTSNSNLLSLDNGKQKGTEVDISDCINERMDGSPLAKKLIRIMNTKTNQSRVRLNLIEELDIAKDNPRPKLGRRNCNMVEISDHEGPGSSQEKDDSSVSTPEPDEPAVTSRKELIDIQTDAQFPVGDDGPADETPSLDIKSEHEVKEPSMCGNEPTEPVTRPIMVPIITDSGFEHSESQSDFHTPLESFTNYWEDGSRVADETASLQSDSTSAPLRAIPEPNSTQPLPSPAVATVNLPEPLAESLIANRGNNTRGRGRGRGRGARRGGRGIGRC